MNFIYIIKKILKAIFYSLNFYLKKPKNEALLAVLPRTGINLTVNLINICYSMKLGLPGKIGVTDDIYSTFAKMDMPLDERSTFSQYTFKPLWHSHLPYSQIVPLRKKFCKTVVLVREPIEYFKSYLLHNINADKDFKDLEKEITISKFMEYDKRHKLISVYLNFLNSWSSIKLKFDQNQVVIIDNKFVKKNTKEYLKFLNKFYNFEFSQNEMDTALEQLDIKRIEKISSEKSTRITKNKIFLSESVKDYINSKCAKKYEEISKLFEMKNL